MVSWISSFICVTNFLFVIMTFLLDDDRSYDMYKKKSRFFGLSRNDGFRVTEAETIAKQRPGGRYVSVFYVMHYMSGIIKAMIHKQLLIIPTHKSLLIKLNNALHVIYYNAAFL